MVFTIPWGLIQPFIGPYFFELTQGDFYLTGLLNGIPLLTMVGSVFIFGWIVDRIGSKIVMMAGFVVFIVLFITLLFIILFINDPFLFFIDYIILNSFLSCFNPAVMKYTSLLKSKVNLFGTLAASTSFGYFLGSYVGGNLFDIFGMGILYFIGLLICVIGFFLVFLIKDLKSEEENDVQYPSSTNPKEIVSQNFLSILFKSRILVILFVIALIQAIQAGFAGSLFSVYFISELEAPASLLGLVFGITTLSGTIIAQYVGKIGEKRGYKPILFISYIGYLFVWTTVFFSVNNYILPALVYTLPVYIGMLVTGPAVITQHVPEHKRGAFMGMLYACQNLGFGSATIFGGLFADIQQTVYYNFSVSAIMAFILILLLLIAFKDEKKEANPSPLDQNRLNLQLEVSA
jgi:MFS family permease